MPGSIRWMLPGIAVLSSLLALTASAAVVSTQDKKAPTTGSISVLVTDGDWKPMAGATVECSAAAPTSNRVTGATGEVVFKDLPFGNCIVTIHPPDGQDLGKARQELVLSKEAPDHNITIDLVPGEWITGMLLTPKGNRAPRAMFQAISQGDDQSGVIDQDEGLRFQSIPGETYWIIVGMLPREAGPFWTYAELDGVPSGSRGLRLSYGIGGVLSGTPVKPDGEASKGEVYLASNLFDQLSEGRIWTEYDGPFLLEHVAAGQYSVLIEDKDGLMGIESVEVKPKTKLDLSTINLSEPAIVRLPVLHFRRVTVLHEGHDVLRFGPAPKVKLAPGLYTLAIEEEDHYRTLTKFRVKPRDELNLEKYGR